MKSNYITSGCSEMDIRRQWRKKKIRKKFSDSEIESATKNKNCKN